MCSTTTSTAPTTSNDLITSHSIHYDRIPHLKFFLYLIEVTIQSGPLLCVPRSHDFAPKAQAANRRNGTIPAEADTRVIPVQYQDRGVRVVGPAGTLLAFTSDIIHLRLCTSLSWMADRATRQTLVFGELTARIRTYPWQRRPHRIAANLLLDTRQQLARAHRRADREVPDGLAPGPRQQDGAASSDEDAEDRIAALDLLRRTRRSGILTKDETEILFGVYMCDLRPEQLATETGRSRSAVYLIRQRAEQKLRQAADRGRLNSIL